MRLGQQAHRHKRGIGALAKRLVIFVEGKGDVSAVPALTQRVVNELVAHDALIVDHDPFRVVGLATLVKSGCEKWRNWLEYAGKTRSNMGAALLVLDGDIDHVSPQWANYTTQYNSNRFCATRAAAMLGQEARAVRAGDVYSLASVFAMKEFEAWLLAGVESLRGKPLAEGRGIVRIDAAYPDFDPESRRDAEGELKKIIPLYSKKLDQGVLAGGVDLNAVRERSRSFRRFCSAIGQLAEGVRSGQHVVTPVIAA